MTSTLVIGSRGSPLALRQSEITRETLVERDPSLQVEIRVIRTTGDKMTQASLAQMAGDTKGLFVKEIQDSLLKGEIDLAVHSLKDLPGETLPGLCLAAIPQREDPRDALIAENQLQSLSQLREKARVGTGSLRRRVQLQLLRPDLEVLPVRGNVETRMKKIYTSDLDAVVLASAGLRRLGLEERISYTFGVEEMIPAVGQGALALETRSEDQSVRQLVELLDDPETHLCVEAERCFLQTIGGGCQFPMGGHASIHNGSGTFSGFVGNPATLEAFKRSRDGHPDELEQIAREIATEILSLGADKVLREFGNQFPS